MRSDFNSEIPMPPIPPGGKRRCSKCRKYKRCDHSIDTEFSTQINKRKSGKRIRYWRGQCKRCEADREQARRRPNRQIDPQTTAENKARRRAMTRLTQAAPRVFLPFLIEELEREYLKLGYSHGQVALMVTERVQYVHRYIRELDG